MVNLIEAIKKGINLHSFFYSKVYGAIKFRPLCNGEVDDVMRMSTKKKSQEVKRLLTEVRLHRKPNDYDKSVIDEVADTLNEMNVWIVYHAVKDFQPEEWQHVDEFATPLGIYMLKYPESYLEVSAFADEVMSFTVRPTEELTTFLKTKDGTALAEAVWKLKVPITDELWKLTDIQLSFLVQSYNGTSVAATIRRAIEKPPTSRIVTPDELALIRKAEEIKNKLRGKKA